jgi:hypothetical protein
MAMGKVSIRAPKLISRDRGLWDKGTLNLPLRNDGLMKIVKRYDS